VGDESILLKSEPIINEQQNQAMCSLLRNTGAVSLKGKVLFNIFYFDVLSKMGDVIPALHRNLTPQLSDIYGCVDFLTGLVDMVKVEEVAKAVVNSEMKGSDQFGGWGSRFNLKVRVHIQGNMKFVLYVSSWYDTVFSQIISYVDV